MFFATVFRKGNGKRSQRLSKNLLLLAVGVLDLSVFTLNTHVLGLVNKFSETKIIYTNILLCLNSMPLKFCL